MIEIKQRFRIPGPISSDIDQSLADYHVQIRDGFYTFWGAHKCDVSRIIRPKINQENQKMRCSEVHLTRTLELRCSEVHLMHEVQ